MSKCINCKSNIPPLSVANLFIINSTIKCSSCGTSMKQNIIRMLPFHFVIYIVAFMLGFMMSQDKNQLFWGVTLLIWLAITISIFSKIAVFKPDNNE